MNGDFGDGFSSNLIEGNLPPCFSTFFPRDNS